MQDTGTLITHGKLDSLTCTVIWGHILGGGDNKNIHVHISPFSTLVWVNEEANSQSLVKDLNIASVNKPIESRNKSPTALIYDRLWLSMQFLLFIPYMQVFILCEFLIYKSFLRALITMFWCSSSIRTNASLHVAVQINIYSFPV